MITLSQIYAGKEQNESTLFDTYEYMLSNFNFLYHKCYKQIKVNTVETTNCQRSPQEDEYLQHLDQSEFYFGKFLIDHLRQTGNVGTEVH